MAEEKKGMEKIRETIAIQFVAPGFNKELVSKKTVEEQLSVHEKAYLGAIISIKTELKFLNDSIDAIEKMEEEDPNGLQTAQNHLSKSKSNPQYFNQTKVDPSCYKALGNLQNIEAKIQEVKTQLWTIEYHSNKIEEVKGYLALY